MNNGTANIISRQALKQHCWECIYACTTNAETWRKSVLRLIGSASPVERFEVFLGQTPACTRQSAMPFEKSHKNNPSNERPILK
jgi:hypothetical protein